MIRKLRIALANWIMPKPQLLSAERTAEMFRQIMAISEQRAVDPPVWKPGAKGYTWFKQVGPTIGDQT